ncbi:MAG: DUF2312 domain-containing protein [Rhodomicrobium sp.]
MENGAVSTSAEKSIAQSAKDQLRSFVERIERLEEEKAALGGDIKDLFAQAKSSGFDTKALRKVIRLRKQEASERRDEEAILATYMHALGMLDDEQ